MDRIQVNEILDIATYEEERPGIRTKALKAKEDRRVRVGEHLTFLFENRETVIYQIQEMMRIERIIKAADIAHEVETYNELVPADGQVSASLLIEYESAAERDVKLRELLGLENHIWLVIGDGDAQHRVQATFDDRQIATDRISSVQYVKWALPEAAQKLLQAKTPPPIAMETDHPHYQARTQLTPAQAAALAADAQ